MTNVRTASFGSIRRHMLAGAAAGVLLVGVLGGWAATTELAGAVVAPGVLVVDTNVKKVQHPTGGVIGEIDVRDGDTVKAGDVVARLDETVTKANLAIVVKGLDELDARQARLEAERDGLDALDFPDGLKQRADNKDVARITQGEQKLFELRLASRLGQKSQYRERIAELEQEIVGLNNQVDAKRQEIELVQKELSGLKELWKQKLVELTKVTSLEREAARLNGEQGQLVANIAQTKEKISETQLQIIQVDQDLRSDVAKELREIQGKSAELVERRVAAEDQLKRIDIRAPQDGIVDQLSVHTVGGVIGPGDPVMLIVPIQDALTVEVKITPQSIDQVSIGQKANLRFSAFDMRTTPEIGGVVSRLSADVTQDQKANASYYVARITMPTGELMKLGKLKLVPGMPVEAFIQTQERTVMSYLTKPLMDQVTKAFRER